MKLTKARQALIICLLIALFFGVSAAFAVNLTAVSGKLLSNNDAKATADKTLLESSGIDVSIYSYTIEGDNECSIWLEDKSVERAIVPMTAIINNKEYTVTSIAVNGFGNAANLEKVWLPRTIKTINSSGFMGCRKLKSITFSDVETIGMGAFAYTNLEYLILPQTVTTVESSILRNCSTPVYIKATEEQVSNYNWESNWNANNSGGTVEYASQFIPPIQYRFEADNISVLSTSRVSTYADVDGVWVVDDYQPFVTDTNVDIYVPAIYKGYPVVGIADWAFNYNMLNTITIGYAETPIRIGSLAFGNFEGSSITINREIYFEADSGDPSTSVFLNTKATTIVLPNTITELGNNAFQQCSNLTDIHFIAPVALPQATEQSLANTLESSKIVTLPETVTTLGANVFNKTNGIIELNIPNSVINVGKNAFVGWDVPQVINIDFESESALGDGWHADWSSQCNLNIIDYNKPQIYEITYILNGGTHSGNPVTYTKKDAFVFNEATREGYTFDGWYDTKTNERVYEIVAGTTQNKELEARWTVNTYTIEYHANKPQIASGNITGATGKSQHVYNAPKALNPNGFILPGWTFNGWKDENGKGYNDGMIVLNLSDKDNDTLHFYGQWLPNYYWITYYENRPGLASSAISGTMENSQHKYDEPTRLNTNNYKLKGWTFKGWKDAAGIFYTDGQDVKTVGERGTVSLQAQWVQNEYDIVFHSNKPGNASNTITGSMTNHIHVKYDAEAFNLNSNAYALKGWKFDSWNREINGSGIKINDRQNNKNWTDEVNGVIHLYAQWVPYTYYIEYYGNGATGLMERSKQYYDTPFMLKSNGFYKKGYHLSTWNTSSNGVGSSFYPNQTYNNLTDIDGASISVYAQWSNNEYRIYYDGNGGSGHTPDTKQKYDEPLKLADNQFTRNGYGFIGWGENPNGPPLSFITDPGKPIIHNFVESGSVTLYAIWDELTYTVRFSGYCNYEGKKSNFGNTPTYTMKLGRTRTKTAPDKCGNAVGAGTGIVDCACKFDHWEVTSDKGKSWIESNITLTIKDLTNIYGEHFEFVAIYVDPGTCVAAGTMITLADGSQIAVEQLTGNELLLTWNLKTGKFDYAPILFIDRDPAQIYEVINLYFSDGTIVKIITEHGFWNFDLNQYVYLGRDAEKYIGDWFNKQTTDLIGNMTWIKVQLTKVEVLKEHTSAWSPVTFSHMCYYVNGMLSMPGGTESLVNIFDVDGDTMKINEDAFNADIAKYGLFTYEEFAAIVPIPEEIFNAFNGQYLKVAMAKGLVNWETIKALVNRYSEFFQ